MAIGCDLRRACLLFGLILLPCGCRPDSQVPLIPARSKNAPSYSTGSADHLKLAMSFVDSLNEYNEVEILSRIHHHLSKWIKESEPDDDWIAEPLYGRLPDRLRIAKGRASLSRLVFQDADIAMMREAIWMRNICQQVIRRPVGNIPLADWLATRIETIGSEPIRDLGVAFELFDWVVRNIQTESPTKTPEGIQYGKRMVWEALLLGRGDSFVKSRAFMLLARQQGIPVVMLAIDQDDGDAEAWLPAALIDEELYLFDMELGVPVPAEEARGIASLSQVVDDPSLLESLALDDRYRVAANDLGRIVAFIDGTPEYLSQRMKLVEQSLTAEDKIKLTCRPSVLGRELRTCKGITNVALWPFAYDSIQMRQNLRSNPQALTEIQGEIGFLSGQTPIARGRLQHFRGALKNTPTKSGAKELYMQSRLSDERINQIASEKEVLKAMLQVKELPKKPAVLANLVQVIQARMRVAKEMASNWLGQLAFEETRYKVAADFFDKRTIQAFPNGIARDGALYNLGRTYERWGRGNEETQPNQELLKKAVEAYELNRDSALKPACEIRASRLRSELE